jgi:hypothetical protein
MSEDAAPWQPFDDGRTIGTPGSESGTILCDDEHADGARITLERNGSVAPFAITCGIYGWMMHTRFFGEEAQARQAYDDMKQALDDIIRSIPLESDRERDTGMKDTARRIAEFVARFP